MESSGHGCCRPSLRAAGLRQIHYVILLPPLEVCLERVQLRVDHGFGDLFVTRDLYEQFANAVVETSDHRNR